MPTNHRNLGFYCFPLKRINLPLRNDCFPGLEQGKYEISLEHHLVPERKKTLKKYFFRGHVKKGKEVSPKGLSLAKSGTTWASKYMMVVTDYNPLNKTGKHESIETQINEQVNSTTEMEYLPS